MRAEVGAGLDTSMLRRLETLDGIAWYGGFGPASDVWNAAFPGGNPVAIRMAYGPDWSDAGVPAGATDGGSAYASPEALAELGMSHAFGRLTGAGGQGFTVAGHVDTPAHLDFLQPLLIAPQGIPDRDRETELSLLVVVAERPDLVAPVADAITAMLAADDPGKVTVETSEELATLRAMVEGQLGSFGQALTAGIFGITGALTAAILYGIVMMRRKDYGRRRALGASQRLIVSLLLVQTLILALTGAFLGTCVSILVLGLSSDPLPPTTYLFSVGILSVAVAVLASLIPAIVASRREPIAELRVP
ncbi:lipoprotein ABC transporter permease [Agromyces mediolanus]|nr:lipoprotein ABC transporter permease [Agromyces mediolanus]